MNHAGRRIPHAGRRISADRSVGSVGSDAAAGVGRLLNGAAVMINLGVCVILCPISLQ